MRNPILIADDSEDDVALLQMTLKHAGITNSIFVVRNGSEIISYFRGEGNYSDRRQFPLPRILFLDLKMPGLGGLDALLWLQGRTQFSQMLIVVLSAVDEWKKIKEAYALGADSFLAKPCNREEIKNLAQYFSAFFDFRQSETSPSPPILNGFAPRRVSESAPHTACANFLSRYSVNDEQKSG